MTNSHNAPTSTKSCFSGILSRLLCTGSLPTHPSDSDRLDKTDFVNYLPKRNEHEVIKGGGTPGVVARLMGLDSLPADMTWVPNKYSIYGHLRSRSVNSADCFPQFDLAAQESYHRRRELRTSVSLSEIPTTFLVCFDKNYGDGQKSSEDEGYLKMMAEAAAAEVKRILSKTKTSTPSTSGNEWNTTKERVVVVKKKKKENGENNKKKDIHEPKRNCLRVEKNVLARNKWNDVCVKSKMKREEVSVGIKRSKQRVKPSRAKKVEPEQHSSVDSVAIISGTMALNPAKKNSTPKVVNSVRKSNAVADDQEVVRAIHITKSEKLMRRREVDFYIDKLVEVCRLTDEEDTQVSPNNWPWISSRSDQVIEFEDYQDICFDFGQEILEMLLQQLVDELNL